ncbi:MAG: fasciclin domain-containing protein, partial [Candidatus Bathyarchaeia archaeon]
LKDIPKLKNILLYHVVPGRVMADDAVKLTSAKTVQGQDITIDASDKDELGRNDPAFASDPVHWHRYLLLNDSSYVLKANVMADNGVIHVINTVLFPK